MYERAENDYLRGGYGGEGGGEDGGGGCQEH